MFITFWFILLTIKQAHTGKNNLLGRGKNRLKTSHVYSSFIKMGSEIINKHKYMKYSTLSTHILNLYGYSLDKKAIHSALIA